MAPRGLGSEGLVGRLPQSIQSPQRRHQASACWVSPSLRTCRTPIHPSGLGSDAPSAGKSPTKLGLCEDRAESSRVPTTTHTPREPWGGMRVRGESGGFPETHCVARTTYLGLRAWWGPSPTVSLAQESWTLRVKSVWHQSPPGLSLRARVPTDSLPCS